MARLKWRSTVERDTWIGDEPCRVVDCRHTSLYVITSDGYEDVICLFHLAAYVSEFIILSSGPSAFEVQPLDQIGPVSGPNGPRPNPTLNGPKGDLVDRLGYISIGRVGIEEVT